MCVYCPNMAWHLTHPSISINDCVVISGVLSAWCWLMFLASRANSFWGVDLLSSIVIANIPSNDSRPRNHATEFTVINLQSMEELVPWYILQFRVVPGDLSVAGIYYLSDKFYVVEAVIVGFDDFCIYLGLDLLSCTYHTRFTTCAVTMS